ncbi:class I SAM-dependent methyltransferase [Streptomyces sp. Je 1-4]|uniref:class I SAM-dependent methyltransferase n=1 Tax=Streptomyces TaxID=1883 RepID=UPI0021D8C8B8|nr:MULTISPECIES: class I SAM-dependent methyltransferase [unclassified Streptomyces]UYB44043.1 class I SAM-dependent methyltransferase [Streptomyces sp. Je 1-4]UZQ40477.1 class I SAM-dependent methyltransferase [Streptomyces sp. Je 1-4] [Streptomyces sp. Je 1-4 4N24]UZQ47894.1 class I SAM-dependent methyltransferase [Streptomyces sp. Je 1-4] [Streptomyces sp. Je 1-4 4N24_ara]
MSAPDRPRFAPRWLDLRERADAAARAPELLRPLRAWLAARTAPAGPPGSPHGLVIRDLGCGIGSMGRWLAVRLPGPQQWILHDLDPALLDLAGARMPVTAADGTPVAATTARGDLAALTADDFAGTSLVTASALLDLLTRDEVEDLAEACVGAGTPALLALSVAGRVELSPSDPFDAEITDAFNDHQRRTDQGRALLGPDAVAAAVAAFERRGARVLVQSSPWRLGCAESALTAEWLRGWVGAAHAQRPELAPEAVAYLRRRLEECAAGELTVAVHHTDLLALPPHPSGSE